MTQEDSQKSWIERLSEALLREPQTQGQLISVLRAAQQNELLDANALEMIESILRFSKLHARDVMIPRGQMVVLEHDATAHTVLPIIIESAHSRFPVINQSLDEIVGVLLAKDVLPLYKQGTQNDTVIEELLRPVTFTPESRRLDALLKDFRQKRNHMAIVIDEYGGVAGLITIEDVLEQIVGDIVDETDEPDDEPNIKSIGKDEYLVNALTTVESFNQYFHAELSDDDSDTIGGFVTHQFGYLPNAGEDIIADGFEFHVASADSRRLNQLRVIYKSQS